MKILFLRALKKRNSDYYQHQALKKIYKNVDIINCEKFFFLPSITLKIFYHISPEIFEPFINNFILSKINKKYDLVYVTGAGAAYIGKKLILKLKKISKKVIIFLEDNAFAKRDKKRWQLYLTAAQYYDLTVTFHKTRITMGKKYGIKKTLLLWPTYQKDVHCKQKLSYKEKKLLSSDIVHIGTWFPERGDFFYKLIRLGLKIKIYGNRWEKDPNFHYMKENITLGHVEHPRYSKIIQCSKISLCLPSMGNVDGLTRRSIEIPAIGTLLLASRTIDHKKLFKENKEAIFFDDVNECYKKCIIYLKDNKKRKQIANSGFIKVTKKLNADYLSAIKNILKKINI
mgnify:FL=1